MLVLFFIFLISVLSPGAVKTKDGSGTALKLSACISEYSKLAIDFSGAEAGGDPQQVVPRILLTGPENPTLVFYTGKKLIHFDYQQTKILNTFAASNVSVINILSGQSADKIFISGGGFSQFDLNSGKSDWMLNLGLTGTFDFFGNVNPENRIFMFPIRVYAFPEKKQVMAIGLVAKPIDSFSAAPPKYTNQIIVIDSESGQRIRDREYHYRRLLSGSTEIFIDTSTWEYEIVDLHTMERKFEGKMNPMDLLFPYQHIAIDRKRLGPEFIGKGKEFSAHLLEKGFVICSRECNASGAVKTSKWTIFDDQGDKVKTIFPAPPTAVDFAVSDLGEKEWPVFMPNMGNRAGVDKIVALEKDGSFSEIALPVIQGMDEFAHVSVRNWFHQGNIFYYTRNGNLYKFVLGSKTGEWIYKADEADGCDTVEAWDANYIMLKPSILARKAKNAILIRLADGKKIKPEEFGESLDTSLWKEVADFNQSNASLPAGDPASGFKCYINYEYAEDFPGKTKQVTDDPKNRYSILMFKVWGNHIVGKYGDIGIVPALMNDKSIALVGISILDNKPLFSLPVVEYSGGAFRNSFPGFPENSYTYLPFNIIRLSDFEALLIVLEKVDLIKIYKINRP